MQKFLSLLRISFKNSHTYFSDVIGTNLIFIMRTTSILLMYRAIYTVHPATFTATGNSFESIAWALIFAQTIVLAKRSNLHAEITREIRSGSIGVKLLFPISYPTGKAITYLTELSTKGIYALIVGLCIGGIMIGSYPEDPRSIFAGLLLVVLGALVSFYGYFLVALLGFFFEDSSSLRWMYSKFDMILGGNILPVVFLPAWLQSIAYASPFIYSGYSAGLIFGQFNQTIFLGSLVGSVFWIAVLVLSCYVTFALAKKHLVSNGG